MKLYGDLTCVRLWCRGFVDLVIRYISGGVLRCLFVPIFLINY